MREADEHRRGVDEHIRGRHRTVALWQDTEVSLSIGVVACDVTSSSSDDS